jgi:2-polyprenyl-3-methyl-5-hydroxy-6-metoxy-1,4-benzoquinol methylase
MNSKLQFFTKRNCPICDGKPYLFTRHKDYFGSHVRLMKCRDCGHGFYYENYKSSQLEAMYGEKYATEYIDESIEHLNRRKQYELDVELLRTYVRDKDINVIDIGCSSGEYLDTMPKEWNKHGMEVNEYLRHKLRNSRPNYKVYSSLQEIGGFFDLVTLRGVIEHIPEHHDLIEFLQKQVKVGGFLFISATPNFDSICSRLYKQHWSQIVCPEHIHQFTSTSLQILLQRANFACKAIHYPYLETPYANWESDSNNFFKYFSKTTNSLLQSPTTRHPFPGNMLSVLFQKIH